MTGADITTHSITEKSVDRAAQYGADRRSPLLWEGLSLPHPGYIVRVDNPPDMALAETCNVPAPGALKSRQKLSN
ncbi:MAG: hypothetical protein J0G33_06445 [Afipia felis]|nr:hypothetical protein [Afipia felis]